MRLIIFLLFMAPTVIYSQQTSPSQYTLDSLSIMRDCACIRLKEARYKDENNVRYKVYLDKSTGDAFIVQRERGRGKKLPLFRYEMTEQ